MKKDYLELAKIIDLQRKSISNRIRGIYNFNAEEIAKLVEIFGLPAEHLMARAAD